MVTDKGLLYIEPKNQPSKQPRIDNLTLKMTAALNRATPGAWTGGQSDHKPTFRPGAGWRGLHLCSCGAVSSSRDFYIEAADIVTNSLCVHYLAFHRDEVPESELKKVKALSFEGEDPTPDQLRDPWKSKVAK